MAAELVRVRGPTGQEGMKPEQIVRRGSTDSVRCRRAMMPPGSAGGDRVPVIAQLVQADEDTVRGVIHRFYEIGLACLDPRRAGGRPRQLGADDEDFVIQTAITRPTGLGEPFTRWFPRELAAHLRKSHGRVIRIGTNLIEAPFGPLRQFTIVNSHHRDHTMQTRALHAYLRRRNANTRHGDVPAAERKERARIRSEKGIRWGGRPLGIAA
ncbi:helix-turn-helix domain-containing protein [Streptomyces fagopyri]|uniref:helix-turn-helix domain-containing protein n=1 Tax=Streptomyces fagopyri TaxID=2662397 RepID=UPI00371DCBC4